MKSDSFPIQTPVHLLNAVNDGFNPTLPSGLTSLIALQSNLCQICVMFRISWDGIVATNSIFLREKYAKTQLGIQGLQSAIGIIAVIRVFC